MVGVLEVTDRIPSHGVVALGGHGQGGGHHRQVTKHDEQQRARVLFGCRIAWVRGTASAIISLSYQCTRTGAHHGRTRRPWADAHWHQMNPDPTALPP